MSNKKDTVMPELLAKATADLVDERVAAHFSALGPALGKAMADGIASCLSTQNAHCYEAITKLAEAVAKALAEDANTRKLVEGAALLLTDKIIEGDKRLGDRIASVERRLPSSGR